MKKYLFLFGINALILLALSANSVMTLLASCSPSGQCTAAVTPLTWVMAVLPIIIILGAGLYFAPRALRGMRDSRVARSEAKAERAEVAAAMGDADEAAQSRLRRFARTSDEPVSAEDGFQDATGQVDVETMAVGNDEISDEHAPQWPTVAHVAESDSAGGEHGHGFAGADPDVAATAEPETDDWAMPAEPVAAMPDQPGRDMVDDVDAAGADADADADADIYPDYADTVTEQAPAPEPAWPTAEAAVDRQPAWAAEDEALPEAHAEALDAMPIDATADGATMTAPAQSWDEMFPSFGAATAPTAPTPEEGPWDWLMTTAQVDQFRPCAQTGFPWAAATIAEMASAVIEQARADRLGDLLPEAEAWLAIATELAPDQPIGGPDADGFIGWVNDLAVHCHLVGEPVSVPTLLAQAMDRLVDRALDDRHLASVLPQRIFPDQPEWEALAKAS